MQEMNDSLYRNYPDAYTSTVHHAVRDNRGGINLNSDKEINNPYVTKYSNGALWQIIKNQINGITENSNYDKFKTKELQNCLKMFNDFIAKITNNRENQYDNPLNITLRAGNLKQFAPYFINFLLNKINSDNDFISEKLQAHYDSLLSFRSEVYSVSFPQSELKVEQFLDWVNFYQSLKELTDQWVHFQIN